MKFACVMLLVPMLAMGCSTLDKPDIKSKANSMISSAGSGAKAGASAIGSGAKAGASAIGSFGRKVGSGVSSSLSSSGDGDSTPTFSDIEQNQVPHVLMRKPVAEGRLTSSFGRRRNPTSWIGFPKYHNGIDYGAPEGTPVLASGSGVIEERRVSTSYGNVVKIRHANGFHSLYAHLAAFGDGIDVGISVSRGQQIGTVGSTGRSTAAHLHYELHYNGKKVNPLFADAVGGN